MHERLGLWRRETILGFSNQHLLSQTSGEWPQPYIVYIPAQRSCQRFSICLSPKICSYFMSCIHIFFTFLQKKCIVIHQNLSFGFNKRGGSIPEYFVR